MGAWVGDWVKNEFILTKRISKNLRPKLARSRPEAGRQNFERISAAIRGRKKPFANRIREFNVYCDLKRMKNEYISTKRIPENLRRNLPDVGRTSAGSRTAKF